MKKILIIINLGLFLNSSANSDDVKKFNIEEISMGSSALNYFSVNQIEDNEQDWFNYSYKEYSTSLLPGKGIYDWFQISYKNDDEDFIIVGLAGIVEKKNYDDKKCNKELDTAALNISELFRETNRSKKKSFKIAYDISKIFYEADTSAKSNATTIEFNFTDKSKIILACYDMDKTINEIKSFFTDINQFDSFRIDIRNHSFVSYLNKKNYEKIY